MKKYVLTLIVTLMVGVGGYGFYTAQNRQAALSSQAQLLLDNILLIFYYTQCYLVHDILVLVYLFQHLRVIFILKC